MNRKAALLLFVHNRFTYTLETVIQGGGGRASRSRTSRSPRTTKTRESRLFKSIPDYLRKAGGVMFRAYAMYQPVQVFSRIALAFFVPGALLWGRFFYYYLLTSRASGHVQSLIIGTGCIVLSFLVGLVAMLAELLAANRRLLEDLLVRLRRLESRDAAAPASLLEGVRTTQHPAWKASLEGPTTLRPFQ